ncbi:MAG: ATP-binding protein [Cyanobacteriota bacterium]|nr:ATP-binding protein [Cyanobacteriota bacterium]
MLIQFTVGNYLSFKEPVTLSMTATDERAKFEKLNEDNVFKIDDELSLLKSAAVYGANASGKSNLVKAMAFMRWFVLNSSRQTQVNDLINVEEFRLSTETEGKPSFFEIIFILEGRVYRYGFEVDKRRVVSEWLFHVPKVKESNLFKRNGNEIKMKKVFKEGNLIADKTRNNALFLSVNAQFNGEISTKIFLWFESKFNVVSGIYTDIYKDLTIEYFSDKKNDILELINKFDLGIDDIKIDIDTWKVSADNLPNSMPEDVIKFILDSEIQTDNIQTFHKKYDSEGEEVSLAILDFDENESEGTKKLFALAVPILDTLKNGEVLAIDELDARFHPLMTRTIIDLFNSKDTNPYNAQLIFMTHDTNLLSNTIFRRDQIWFVEKNKEGVSDLYSLVEFKVDNNADFENDYIKGKYGAIPFIGNFIKLFGEKNGSK